MGILTNEVVKEDQFQVVLTVDRGVAMVVMDKEDYTDKALSLLADDSTYSIINTPLPNLKTNLPRHLGTLNTKEDSVTAVTGKCIPKVLSPQGFMAFPKHTNLAPP